MADHDGPTTLHYLDPPYVWDTRSPGNPDDRSYGGYVHEMTDADHRELLAFAGQLEGMVALSGYRHPIYEEALVGWQRHDMAAHADGARARVESLWLNPLCGERLPSPALQFDLVAVTSKAKSPSATEG
jgi:DNA adenine methylase